MKKAEMDNLVVGMIIKGKKDDTEYKITAIEDNKVMLDEVKSISMSTLKRWYDFVAMPEEEKEEKEEKVVAINIVEPKYNEGQIITDLMHLENFFIQRIIPRNYVNKDKMFYEYTLQNMHTNEVIIVAESIIEEVFALTTNELMERVANAHKPQEEKPEQPKQNIDEEVTIEAIINHVEQMNCDIKQNSTHIVAKKMGKNLMEIYPTKRRGISVTVRQTILSEEQKEQYGAKIVGAGTYVLDCKFKITSMEQFKDVFGQTL